MVNDDTQVSEAGHKYRDHLIGEPGAVPGRHQPVGISTYAIPDAIDTENVMPYRLYG